jgi:hypothetical protein
MADGGAARAPAVAHLREEGHVAGADGLGQGDLVGRLHRVGAQAVDLAGRDAGVTQRGDNGLGRQLGLGPVDLLGELGLPDADDRRRVLQGAPRPGHGE